MKKNLLSITSAILLILIVFGYVNAQKRGPSTTEERVKAVSVVDSLESEPLSEDAKNKRAVLLAWIDDVPDITVRYCTEVLGDPRKLKGDHGSIFVGQLIFSATKFIIQNPDKADDDAAVNLAALEGVLKTYGALKIAKPKVRIETLDTLLESQEKGTLGEYVKAAMVSCPR